MKFIKTVICLIRGHLPISLGSGLYDMYGWIKPQFERTTCFRCGVDIPVFCDTAIVKRLEGWKLDEHTVKSLVVKDFLGGEGALSQYYPGFLGGCQGG